MAYDTDLTLEQAILDISRLFGEGAAEIRKIFRHYEGVLDGQVPISETGEWFARHVDRDETELLFGQALKKAQTARCRNNIRLMRMAFRYTMLLYTGTLAAQEELGVMRRFDSFTASKRGYGIAIASDVPIQELSDDPWYQFEE
jgi:hypothetical protein